MLFYDKKAGPKQKKKKNGQQFEVVIPKIIFELLT